MKSLVRKGYPTSSSVVPPQSVPKGNTGKAKPGLISGSKANMSSVVRSPKPASSNKRGGPAQKAPSGRGAVSSGGGSFGQN